MERTEDDIFDAALELEDMHISEGYAQGLKEGQEKGILEGQQLGVLKGFEIGQEVGVYSGAVATWLWLQKNKPDLFSARTMKVISSMKELISQFPLNNPQDENLQEYLQQLQGKFKTVSAILGLSHDYLLQQLEKAAASSLSF